MKSYFSEDLIKKAIGNKLLEHAKQETESGIVVPLVFADKIYEGAVEPFFLIQVIDVSQYNDIRNTAWRIYQMKVQYYLPETDLSRITNLRKMGEKLLGILNIIDVEYAKEGSVSKTRPLKAKKNSYQITENVLNFFCVYKVKVYYELPENIKMRTLDINSY